MFCFLLLKSNLKYLKFMIPMCKTDAKLWTGDVSVKYKYINQNVVLPKKVMITLSINDFYLLYTKF